MGSLGRTSFSEAKKMVGSGGKGIAAIQVGSLHGVGISLNIFF